MTTKRAVRGALFALVLGLAVVAPVSAQPTTDLVEVMAEVSQVFPGPGGYVAHVEWGVRTHEDDPELSVLLNAYMVFSNNLRKQVFPPEVLTLEPGDVVVIAACPGISVGVPSTSTRYRMTVPG